MKNPVKGNGSGSMGGRAEGMFASLLLLWQSWQSLTFLPSPQLGLTSMMYLGFRVTAVLFPHEVFCYLGLLCKQ